MLMAYTKTQWNEDTPITVDRLNNIENGIASALSLTGGTLTGNLVVHGTTQLNGHTSTGDMNVYGGLGIRDGVEIGGRLAFSNFGIGGGTSANIHNLALHSATGNGQMMTAGVDNKIYVGNTQTPLILESNTGVVANIGGTNQRILTERDSCARLSWNGSRISIDGGGNNASVSFSDVSEIARHLHNHHTGQNFKLRAAAGLAPADGWLTMTW